MTQSIETQPGDARGVARDDVDQEGDTQVESAKPDQAGQQYQGILECPTQGSTGQVLGDK
ncbi:MAG: hypothetical protein OHK0015_14870 [Chloroflexi bacterium OHK40]